MQESQRIRKVKLYAEEEGSLKGMIIYGENNQIYHKIGQTTGDERIKHRSIDVNSDERIVGVRGKLNSQAD